MAEYLITVCREHVPPGKEDIAVLAKGSWLCMRMGCIEEAEYCFSGVIE